MDHCVRISLAYVQTVILDEADQMLEQRLATRLQNGQADSNEYSWSALKLWPF